MALFDTKKIREKYGTVKRFCEIKGINYNTWKIVNSGNGKSKRIEKIMKRNGFLIKDINR